MATAPMAARPPVPPFTHESAIIRAPSHGRLGRRERHWHCGNAAESASDVHTGKGRF
jgi:hypothetical protein